MRRLSSAQWKARQAEASELARQRATQWRVWRRDREGNLLASFHIVDASSEEEAIIAVCDMEDIRRSDARAPKAARPLLSSKDWRAIHQEVGLL